MDRPGASSEINEDGSIYDIRFTIYAIVVRNSGCFRFLVRALLPRLLPGGNESRADRKS